MTTIPSCGRSSATTARILNWVDAAERCRAAGDFRKARHFYQKALESGERAFGCESAEVATLLNNLGVVCKYLGRYREAGRHYRRALRILAKLGASPTTLASLYHNLGGLEHARGRFARGEPWARTSVALRERELGPRHPEVAADLAALAALLVGQGKCDEAERLYRRALTIFRRVYGLNHYEVAVTLNNLAAIAQAQGDLSRSLRLYRRALALKERLLGEAHPDIGITCNNLATLHKVRGELSLAVPLYQRALDIFETALGRMHPHTNTCRENLRRVN